MAEIEYLELRQVGQDVLAKVIQIYVFQVGAMEGHVYQVNELALMARAMEAIRPCPLDSVLWEEGVLEERDVQGLDLRP